MKLIYLTCIIIFNSIATNYAVDFPDHFKVQAKKLHNRCQKETGVEEDVIKSISTGNFANDRTLQCYLHCLFDKVGLIDEKNVMHLENILEVLPTEIHSFVQNLVNLCGTKNGADGCETAFLTVKCYYETDPEIFKNKFDFIFE